MIRVLWKLICMDIARSKIGVNEDAFKPFVMVSDAEISQTIPITETSMSARFSNMCRKAWCNMSVRFYRTDSMDSSEIPVKRMKQHNRRKANAIATGRGRGRAKCQLRRSGVSQTRHRKEGMKHVQDDYKIWQELYSVQNECTVDETDGYDVPDAAQFMKKTTSPIILNLSDITPTKQKQKARHKQEEVKCPTRVRYISSIKINNNHEDSEMYERNPSRTRLLSECTNDSEDSFVVFEDSDDELLEARDVQDATEYVNKARCLLNDSWMRSINQINCNSNKCDIQSPLRQRLLSESSIDSEDSFCIVFKSQSDCANDCMIEDWNEINFCNQDSMSEDNSTIRKESIKEDDQESGATTTHSDQDSEELIAKTKKVSFDLNPVVHIMVKWDYAYRAARKGPWEEMARDNERFKGRINSIAAVLNPILTNNHRSQVWQKRFAL